MKHKIDISIISVGSKGGASSSPQFQIGKGKCSQGDLERVGDLRCAGWDENAIA